MHPASAPRPAPAWLRDESFTDATIGTLKSGKEAEVFVVERRYRSGATVLLAHKRYRPRRPARGELRELGFQRATGFRHASRYHAGWQFSSRERRAVATHTAHGREIIEARWPVQELIMLGRAWASGASVPYPVAGTDDGVLMELIGDAGRAAPRLAQAGLGRDEARTARDQLLGSMRQLASAGIVHADLSPYNVLWWRGRAWLIDMPQAVEFATNPDAPDLLRRDLENVATWLARRDAPIDLEATLTELLTLASWPSAG